MMMKINEKKFDQIIFNLVQRQLGILPAQLIMETASAMIRKTMKMV